VPFLHTTPHRRGRRFAEDGWRISRGENRGPVLVQWYAGMWHPGGGGGNSCGTRPGGEGEPRNNWRAAGCRVRGSRGAYKSEFSVFVTADNGGTRKKQKKGLEGWTHEKKKTKPNRGSACSLGFFSSGSRDPRSGASIYFGLPVGPGSRAVPGGLRRRSIVVPFVDKTGKKSNSALPRAVGPYAGGGRSALIFQVFPKPPGGGRSAGLHTSGSMTLCVSFPIFFFFAISFQGWPVAGVDCDRRCGPLFRNPDQADGRQEGFSGEKGLFPHARPKYSPRPPKIYRSSFF